MLIWASTKSALNLVLKCYYKVCTTSNKLFQVYYWWWWNNMTIFNRNVWNRTSLQTGSRKSRGVNCPEFVFRADDFTASCCQFLWEEDKDGRDTSVEEIGKGSDTSDVSTDRLKEEIKSVEWKGWSKERPFGGTEWDWSKNICKKIFFSILGYHLLWYLNKHC